VRFVLPSGSLFAVSRGRTLLLQKFDGGLSLRYTETESDKIISSGGPVRAVLEVAAGTARKLGIEPGDRVASPTLRR
jgi:hypothetical protein